MFAVPDLLYARACSERAPRREPIPREIRIGNGHLTEYAMRLMTTLASAAAGVALLAGSACSERIPQPSPVRAACAGTRMNTPILRMQR